MEEINIVLLVIQVLILIIQCTSEIRAGDISRGEKKGVFQIAYRNTCINYFEKSSENGPIWLYDIDKYISFKNVGDDSVAVLENKIRIDGNLTTHEISKNKAIFSNDRDFKDFSVLSIKFNPSEADKKKGKMAVKMTLVLKNSTGYKYKQIIEMTFGKMESTSQYNDWRLIQYGWEFVRVKWYSKYIEKLRDMI